MQAHHFIKIEGSEEIFTMYTKYAPYEFMQTLKFSVEDKIVIEYMANSLRVIYHANDSIETIYEVSGDKVSLFYGKLLSEMKSKVKSPYWAYYIVEESNIFKQSI